MAMMKEATFIKALISSLGKVYSTCVVEYMVTDGVTWAYHERGRLRPEGVKVIEKCDECDVWMGVV